MGLLTRSFAGVMAAAFAVTSFAQFDGPAPLAWRWSESTTAVPSGTPIVNNGIVYTAVGGRIYGLERETGNLVWRYPSGTPLDSKFRTGLTYADGKIVAATDGKVVYCVDAKTGALQWQYTAADSIIGTPAITDNNVVFPLSGNQIGGVQLANGSPLWPDPIKAKDRVMPNITATMGAVVYGENGAKLVAINITDKKLRWEAPFTGRMSADSAPILYNDSIYVNADRYVVCLRAANGRVKWQQPATERLLFSPAAGPDGVIVIDERGTVYTFNANGTPTTRAGFKADLTAQASPAWVGKYALVPTAGGELVLLDSKTGDRVWNFTVPPLTKSDPAAAGGADGKGGGAGPGAGPGGGAGGLGAPPGGGGGGAQANSGAAVKYVVAAGAGTEANGTLLIMARDGSLLAFDKTNGVDLTAPVSKMVWPNPGDQISPNPPAELVIKLEDYTSGINPMTVGVTINGQPMVSEFKDGYVRIKFFSGGKNVLPIGRATIALSASDWLGNNSVTNFVVMVDPAVDKPLGSPPSSNPANQNNLPGGGGKGGGGKG